MLSIIIPVYNERHTLAAVLAAVGRALPGVPKDIIVVDDCSTDGTRDWLRANFPDGPRSGCQISIDGLGGLEVEASPNGAPVTIRPGGLMRAASSPTRSSAPEMVLRPGFDPGPPL